MAGIWQRLVFGPLPEAMEQLAAQQVKRLELPAAVLLGEEALTLRLAEAGDKQALLEFGQALPPEDLLFLRRDITRQEHIDAWLTEIEEGRATTMLALQGPAVVGYATVARDGLSWTEHVAELRILVAPRWRGRRLGRVLVEQAFAIARDLGVVKMMAQMTVEQEAAHAVFKSFGFRDEALLVGQVKDRGGRFHDLRVMSLNVEAFRARVTALEVAMYSGLET